MEVTDQFIEWWSTLSDAQREAVIGTTGYAWAVPLADDLYDEYLRELGEEGDLMARTKFSELGETVVAKPGAPGATRRSARRDARGDPSLRASSW